MKIVTAAEMREIDRATSERFGVHSLTLMENAGASVADFVLSHYSSARRIVVICGRGRKHVQVVLLADPAELRGDAREMFSKVPVPVMAVHSSEEWKTERVQLTLHTGFKPPVSGLYAEAIATLNASTTPVVAVDIPSGADADVMGHQTGAVTRANAIVTFTVPRPAHVFGELSTGPTYVAPIGSPDEAISSSLGLNVITAHDVAPIFAPRTPDAHKGSFGHVLILGGSVGKAGAAAMAGIAALRVGAGLSTVATAKSVLPTVAGFHPEVMTEPLEETDAGTISTRSLERVGKLVEGKTVLAVGPGISHYPDTTEFVRKVVTNHHTPIVLDADGLNAFANHATELNGSERPLILTPHPGEMARLIGSTSTAVQHDRLNIARTFAREHQLILVLKGHRTLIAQPDGTVWVNTTGNPGMATGGTGDILTGMIAGFIAQNPERILDAVLAAVHLHGLAGDVARETVGEHSLVATDLLKALPEAFRRAREQANQKLVRI